MRKRVIFLLLVFVFFAGFVSSYSIADSPNNELTPGSADDPLITKSYVDEQVRNLVASELKNMKEQFAADMATEVEKARMAAQSEFASELTKMRQTALLNVQSLKLITLKPGNKLVLQAGTEAIVRKGKAIISSPDKYGVLNITTGINLLNGSNISNDQLILFTRSGRAIYHNPTFKSEVLILVKGTHSIQIMN